MKKWVLSAIAYFLIVIAIYYGWTAIAEPPADHNEHSETEQHEK
nr:hypothetical protein [uncultured Bacillus sp.]